MPGIREAIEAKEWKLADEQVTKLAAAFSLCTPCPLWFRLFFRKVR